MTRPNNNKQTNYLTKTLFKNKIKIKIYDHSNW